MHRLGRLTRTIVVSAGIAALAYADAALAAPPGAPPAEAFATLPGVQMVAISPNGKLLAQDDVKDGQKRIIIWDIDTTKTLRVINVDAANKMRGLDWADDQTVLVDASIQKAVPCNASNRCTVEWWRTLAVTLDGAPPHVLLMDAADRQWVTGSTMLAKRTGRPNSVTMETLDWLATREKQSTGSRIAQSDRDRDGWTHVVFDVDTRTGKGKPLATGTTYTYQWVVDRAGDPVARSEWVATRKEFSIHVRHGSSWSRVFEQSGHDPLTLSGLTPDGKSIVVLAAIDSEYQKAWAFPLDGTARSVLYEIADGDVESALTDANSHAVVALQTGGAEPGIHWLDAKLGAHYRALTNAFAGKRVVEVNTSNDGQRVVAMVDSASRPPTYHLVDFDKSRADVIGEAYPALATARLGDVRTIHYPARDGTSISAYLTLPPGGASKNLPVVVLPHGGPHARDTSGFDYIVQFLATRGYAILQPQFRGSTGFGDAYVKAGYRQWGGLMQDDVTDGVKHLIADGTADPKRICIAGLSYGGYAALAGAAFTPELYACAASVGGVSDLPTLLIEAKRPFGSDTDDVASDEERIGKPSDPNVIARSPARSAASVVAPVLLLHGVDDSVVPIAQSERMAKALEKAGKPVKFVKLPGEDHWLSRSDTRLQVLKELDAFLAPFLAPAASSAPAAAKAP